MIAHMKTLVKPSELKINAYELGKIDMNEKKVEYIIQKARSNFSQIEDKISTQCYLERDLPRGCHLHYYAEG